MTVRFALLCMFISCTALVGQANAALIDEVNAALVVIDNDTPTNFSFLFTVPTAALTGIFESRLELSGELTDAGRDGVSAVPFDTVAIAQALIEGSGVIDLGPASFVSGPYGPFTLSTLVDSANFGGTIDNIGLRITFTASGGGDQISFTGKHSLYSVETGIPAPATVGLFVLGLSALGWARRRNVTFV